MQTGLAHNNMDVSAPIEAVMRRELAQSDAVINTAQPVLRHLLSSDDHSLFNEEIVARLRGMFADISYQIIDIIIDNQGGGSLQGNAIPLPEMITERLMDVPGLMVHLHGLALEWRLTEQLQSRLSLDPVLTPLLQELIASTEPGVASAAMNFLASQARFAQNQRRMQMSLTELPADLLHSTLMVARSFSDEDIGRTTAPGKAEAFVRTSYDEGRSRLGLISRLLMEMGESVMAAFSLADAGPAIFLSALSVAADHDRALASLATHEGQLTRFVLTLRAIGFQSDEIEQQLLALHPDAVLPHGIDEISIEQAAEMLAALPSLVKG